jgi:hypothetical protein
MGAHYPFHAKEHPMYDVTHLSRREAAAVRAELDALPRLTAEQKTLRRALSTRIDGAR